MTNKENTFDLLKKLPYEQVHAEWLDEFAANTTDKWFKERGWTYKEFDAEWKRRYDFK